MDLYKRLNLRYSALNSARCALSMVVGTVNLQTIGCHPLVKRFMKGVWSKRPALARYSHTWDASIVIDYLRSRPDTQQLPLRNLTCKLVTLLALISGHRSQSLQRLDISLMSKTADEFSFYFKTPLKHNSEGKAIKPLVFSRFADELAVCAYTLLEEYIRRTTALRGPSQQLLLSFQTPYLPVSTSTVSRWIRETMSLAGIDTAVFKAHSTRSASSSKVVKFLPITDVLKACRWSERSTSFRKHYRRDIQIRPTFAEIILTH